MRTALHSTVRRWCAASDAHAAHFGEAQLRGLHASGHDAEETMQDCRPERRVFEAALFERGAVDLEGRCMLAGAHLKERVLGIEQGTPSEDSSRSEAFDAHGIARCTEF